MNSDELFLNQTFSLMFAHMDDASLRNFSLKKNKIGRTCFDADHL